jgi:dTDP-4-amino-4,6-dideoxygalactose transaminase
MAARGDDIPLLDLRAQYQTIAGELEAAAHRVLSSGRYVLGPEVEAFEEEFAAYCGSSHCVGVDSGTSALHLALLALGVGPGDEVLTVSHTFVATVAAIRYTGARPVLVDVVPESSTLDPSQLEAAISPRTRAVLPVHLHGRCADMELIVAVAGAHRLAMVEDAAQAHGARHRGHRAGTMGELGCFSFYPGKNLGACGEAGAVVTDDPALAARLRMLRDHGQAHKYVHEVLGFNHRIDALQAAVLRAKLPHLDGWNAARRRLAASYHRHLAGSGIGILPDPPDGEAVHHILPVFVAGRDTVRAALAERGIGTGIHYPVPVHLQPAHADLGYGAGDLPVTERLSRQTLSLPIYPELSEEAVLRVATALRELSRPPEAPPRS